VECVCKQLGYFAFALYTAAETASIASFYCRPLPLRIGGTSVSTTAQR